MIVLHGKLRSGLASNCHALIADTGRRTCGRIVQESHKVLCTFDCSLIGHADEGSKVMLSRACSRSIAEYRAAMPAKGLSGDQVDLMTIRSKSVLLQSGDGRYMNNHEDPAYVFCERGSMASGMWCRASNRLMSTHETTRPSLSRGINVSSDTGR
jgi:hypothetical protein